MEGGTGSAEQDGGRRRQKKAQGTTGNLKLSCARNKLILVNENINNCEISIDCNLNEVVHSATATHKKIDVLLSMRDPSLFRPEGNSLDTVFAGHCVFRKRNIHIDYLGCNVSLTFSSSNLTIVLCVRKDLTILERSDVERKPKK